MGLKDFLKQQGFIEDSDKTAAAPKKDVAPAFFPVNSSPLGSAQSSSADDDPSFVIASPVQQQSTGTQLDPTFIKFFEDEMVKANLPGPDYFEFRQQLTKTQQKMSSKGGASPELVLQAVLMSFEAQNITSANLIETAQHYKVAMQQKNDDFLKGAEAEKNNQLQKRQAVLQSHTDNIQKIQQQLQQLEIQKQQLNDALNKEKTQLEVDKTLGKEGIAKIEKAEQLIGSAYTYIQASIDADIKRLQNT
jgi:hypothetical protein